MEEEEVEGALELVLEQALELEDSDCKTCIQCIASKHISLTMVLVFFHTNVCKEALDISSMACKHPKCILFSMVLALSHTNVCKSLDQEGLELVQVMVERVQVMAGMVQVMVELDSQALLVQPYSQLH